MTSFPVTMFDFSELPCCEFVIVSFSNFPENWNQPPMQRVDHDTSICATVRGYRTANEALELLRTKQSKFSKSVESLSRNRDLNMTKNWHVFAICCRPEADYDDISGGNVKIIVGYDVVKMLNLLALTVSEIFPQKSFRDDGGGGGGGRHQQ